MLKGKILLFCLLFVAVAASFLISYHAKGNLPHIVSVEIGSLLVFEAIVAFFADIIAQSESRLNSKASETGTTMSSLT